MKTNPALHALELFIGAWDLELSNAAFLPDPSTVIHGSVSFEWIEDGAFAAMRQGKDAVWIIGRDEKMPHHSVLYREFVSTTHAPRPMR